MSRPRVDRSAFLYLGPREPRETHAQCETCRHWTGPEDQHCSLFGSGTTVQAGDTCGLYTHAMEGQPIPEPLEANVSPYEAGFERRQVRCENCRYFFPRGECRLFMALNESLPGMFDLDTRVDAFGCCNANMPLRLTPLSEQRTVPPDEGVLSHREKMKRA
jgi:hypothetical protein